MSVSLPISSGSVQSHSLRPKMSHAPINVSNGIFTKKRILLASVNSLERRTLAEQMMLYLDFEIVECESGVKVIALMNKENFDGVVMDSELSDVDGLEVCRAIRRNRTSAPIIVISGQDSESEEILSFEAGANDYLTRPLRPRVLFARLRTHLRQAEMGGTASLPIGPYLFWPSENLMNESKTGNEIKLTAKESAVLKLLYSAGDIGVGNDVIYKEVWGYTSDLHTHTLATHIYRLRKKIELDPSQPTYLLSCPGGYRLVRHF